MTEIFRSLLSPGAVVGICGDQFENDCNLTEFRNGCEMTDRTRIPYCVSFLTAVQRTVLQEESTSKMMLTLRQCIKTSKDIHFTSSASRCHLQHGVSSNRTSHYSRICSK